MQTAQKLQQENSFLREQINSKNKILEEKNRQVAQHQKILEQKNHYILQLEEALKQKNQSKRQSNAGVLIS
jgi:hypothetical protein